MIRRNSLGICDDFIAFIKNGDCTKTRMFEPSLDMKMKVKAIGAFPNNLSIYHHEAKGVTFACTTHKSTVNLSTWDSRQDNCTLDSLHVKDDSSERPVLVLQAKLVHPNCRSTPLIVVATSAGAKVFDSRTHKLLAQNHLDVAISEVLLQNESNLFTRGISWVDNFILVGTYTGEIMVFSCSGETSVNPKKSLAEHRDAVADIATCRFDDLTCSADMGGTVIVWGKNAKTVQKKISTDYRQEINVINVLRKQCIVGTMSGKVLFYSTATGALMAEVACHVRPVTSIAVAPESAYVMTSGEDSQIRVFKLHTRKPEAYQVEYRFGDEIENEVLVGAQFSNGRGSGLVVASYDNTHLHMYKIAKKSSKASENEPAKPSGTPDTNDTL